MTPIDRFERQLPVALTELADPRTPDYLVDILGQTVRTRQRPAWANPGRWNPMPGLTRPSMLAAAALVVVVVVVGGVLISTRNQPVVGGPTASPGAPTAVPSAGASAAALAPGTTPKPGPVPDALLGAWVAPLRPVAGLSQSATSAIDFYDIKKDPQAPGFNIELGARSYGQEARADEVEPGVLRFVSRASPGGCLDKDLGKYRWSMPSVDHLTLELVSDQCSARSSIAPGTWIRSGIGASQGGTGLAADFTPFFEFTLPAGSYHGLGNMHDAISMTGQDGSTFQAWKDPDGFSDACSEASRIDLDPGIDAFVAYLKTSNGQSVTGTTETTIDGHRAVQVDLTTKAGLDPEGCYDGGGVLQWVPNSWDGGVFAIEVGADTTIFVTEVGGSTIVFEALDGSGASAPAVVQSIKYLAALPS